MTESPENGPEPADAAQTPRQDEVLEHTLALVREAGIGGVTVRRVAERVGFSEAALYRHFDSKQALLVALLRRLGGYFLEPIQAIAERHELSAAERLQRILEHHVHLILETDGVPILMIVEASIGGDEVLLGEIRGILGRYLAVLEALYEEAVPEGRVRPRELGLLSMGLPAAIAIRHRVLPDAGLEKRARGPLARFLVERLISPSKPQEENR